MIAPLTQRQQDLIVKNLVSACKDINKLNGTGYKFIYLASGFIAHYNIDGFKSYYSNAGKLQRTIEENAQYNQWKNFSKGDDNYDYYMSRREVYNRVLGHFCAQEFFGQFGKHLIDRGAMQIVHIG